jgi:type IV secretory pathway VirB4 component
MAINDTGNVLDLVSVKEIKEGTVIMKSGTYRQILMVGGTNFSLKSESEQNIITEAYQNFLNSVNFPVQIIIHSRKINIEKYLKKLDERRAGEPSPLLQDQILEYQEFVRGFIKDNAIMVKTFFVVVPYTPVSIKKAGGSLLDALPVIGKKRAASEKEKEEKKKNEEEKARDAAEEFEKALVQLKQRVGEVSQGLFAIGLESIALNDEQLTELFYNFYNPETVEKEKAEKAHIEKK